MDKKKILIIDDENGFTELLKDILEETGRYEVETENEGRLGFFTAKNFCPDLILLDVVMPDIDGSVVAGRLKSDKETENIPIIFLTGTITPDEAKEQKDGNGGRLYLAKPVVLKELMQCVEKKISMTE